MLNEKNPAREFQFSNNWLSDFRIGTTFHFGERLTAHKKTPSDLEPVIKKFHSYFPRLQSSGDYQDGDILRTWIRHLCPSY